MEMTGQLHAPAALFPVLILYKAVWTPEPVCDSYIEYIVMCISIAGQRIAKHILAATNTQAKTEELPFLCNDKVNTPL
jgi:hypothetical protein